MMSACKVVFGIMRAGFLGGFLLVMVWEGSVIAQEQPGATASQAATEKRLFLNGDTCNMKDGLFNCRGNAQVIMGDDSVRCDELTVHLTPEQQVEKAIAKGNVQILTGEITATSDQGIFYLDEQRVELEGHAKAGQGNNTITAHRIVAWLEGNAIEGYGSQDTERVVMTIYSTTETEASTASPTEEGEAELQPSLIGIESDTLKYDESQGYAIFTGDVNAQQNGIDIHSDEMRVYLVEDQETEANDIERIEVEGNVRIVQEAYTITGAEGVFVNADQSAVITGTTEQQARAENSAEKSLLKADTITIFLGTNNVDARGNVSLEMILAEPAGKTNS